jgi:hypothetical protein
MNDTLQLEKPLFCGVYDATESFRAIEKHSCVCYEDLALVATTGPAGDPLSEQYAELFSRAPYNDMAAKMFANVWQLIRRNGLEEILLYGDPEALDEIAFKVLECNDLPVITQTNQTVRRAHCSYCGGKSNSLKAELVRSPLGIEYRIPLSHASCKQSVLSLSLFR